MKHFFEDFKDHAGHDLNILQCLDFLPSCFFVFFLLYSVVVKT